MRLSMQIRREGLKELVIRLEELGQLREWRWEVFHPRGHKDVPLVTLHFCRRRIRLWSYARSVTIHTGDPVGWQPGLSIVGPIRSLQ